MKGKTIKRLSTLRLYSKTQFRSTKQLVKNCQFNKINDWLVASIQMLIILVLSIFVLSPYLWLEKYCLHSKSRCRIRKNTLIIILQRKNADSVGKQTLFHQFLSSWVLYFPSFDRRWTGKIQRKQTLKSLLPSPRSIWNLRNDFKEIFQIWKIYLFTSQSSR